MVSRAAGTPQFPAVYRYLFEKHHTTTTAGVNPGGGPAGLAARGRPGPWPEWRYALFSN
jgi:hypothetical protein